MAQSKDILAKINVTYDKVSATPSFSGDKQNIFDTGSILNRAYALLESFVDDVLKNPEDLHICQDNYLYIENSLDKLFEELYRPERSYMSKIDISNVIIAFAANVIEHHNGLLAYESHPIIKRDSEAGTLLYHVEGYLKLKFVQLVTMLVTNYAIDQIHVYMDMPEPKESATSFGFQEHIDQAATRFIPEIRELIDSLEKYRTE